MPPHGSSGVPDCPVLHYTPFPVPLPCSVLPKTVISQHDLLISDLSHCLSVLCTIMSAADFRHIVGLYKCLLNEQENLDMGRQSLPESHRAALRWAGPMGGLLCMCLWWLLLSSNPPFPGCRPTSPSGMMPTPPPASEDSSASRPTLRLTGVLGLVLDQGESGGSGAWPGPGVQRSDGVPDIYFPTQGQDSGQSHGGQTQAAPE